MVFITNLSRADDDTPSCSRSGVSEGLCTPRSIPVIAGKGGNLFMNIHERLTKALFLVNYTRKETKKIEFIGNNGIKPLNHFRAKNFVVRSLSTATVLTNR